MGMKDLYLEKKREGITMKTIEQFLKDEEGATMAEYALLLGLITVAVATVIATFRGQLAAQFTRAGDEIAPQ